MCDIDDSIPGAPMDAIVRSPEQSNADRTESSELSSPTPSDRPESPLVVGRPNDDASTRKVSVDEGLMTKEREVAEHQIRAHDAKIPCHHCSKNLESVSQLAYHMEKRHPSEPLSCYYCKDDFSSKVSIAGKVDWQTYRKHIYQEVLKKKMYVLASKDSKESDLVALRGVGRCPHGPPVKCKNFPNCPGERCIYSHGLCRFDKTCQKQTCPFDHASRPRTCMTCLNDIKGGRSGGRNRH
ncbi:unnamed protein product, partial [Mesorhabditis spiculigera]